MMMIHDTVPVPDTFTEVDRDTFWKFFEADIISDGVTFWMCNETKVKRYERSQWRLRSSRTVSWIAVFDMHATGGEGGRYFVLSTLLNR